MVTAQKREQSLIDVPAAISAFSGNTLDKLNVQNLPEITTHVPNFRVTYERGTNSIANFTLRGVRGAALASRLNESSVATYANEVFMGDETAINGALFDVERVEVLRGPQGTVFGKNTTGGLVHFISAKPTDTLSGNGSVQYGSDNQVIVEGAVSGPVSDGIRVRLAGKMDRDDGHYRNRFVGAGSNGVEKNVGDKDAWALRGTVDFDLSERTLLRVIGTYTHDDSQPAPGITYGSLLPGTTKVDGYTRSDMCGLDRILSQADCISVVQVTEPTAETVLGREAGTGITNLTPEEMGIRGRGRSFTANLTHDMDWATFTSVTNYTNNDYSIAFDADAGATPSAVIGGNAFDFIADYTNEAEHFSQEVRLNGSTDGFDWVGGLFYYTDEKSSVQQTNLRSFGVSRFNTGALDTESMAAFAQLDAHISDQVTLSIGGRYTKESRQLKNATTYTLLNATNTVLPDAQDILAEMTTRGLTTKTNNKDFTGKISLTWQPDSDNTFYASYSRGIKGAGFNSGFSPADPIDRNIALAGPVGQEILDAFEIGSKNRFFDRRLSINTAAFYYDFSGKQEQVFAFVKDPNDPNDPGNVSQNYLNIGDAEIYGIETEIMFSPSQYFDFHFSGGWLHGKVTKSDVILTDSFGANVPAQGLSIADVPDWTFFSYAAYHLPVSNMGTFTFQPEVRGVDKTNSSLTNDPLSGDKSHLFVNARVMWEAEDGGLNIQAFVSNLFKEKSMLNPRDVVLGTTGKYNTTEGLGRLWGVRLGASF